MIQFKLLLFIIIIIKIILVSSVLGCGSFRRWCSRCGTVGLHRCGFVCVKSWIWYCVKLLT